MPAHAVRRASESLNLPLYRFNEVRSRVSIAFRISDQGSIGDYSEAKSGEVSFSGVRLPLATRVNRTAKLRRINEIFSIECDC